MKVDTGKWSRIALGLVATLHVGFAVWYLGNGLPLEKIHQIFLFPSLANIDRLEAKEWIALSCLLTAPGALYLIRRHPRAPAAKFLRMHERYALVFISIALIIGALCLEIYDATNKTSIAIMIAALFATAGWIFTTFMGAKNATKAHTMSILIQMRVKSHPTATPFRVQ